MSLSRCFTLATLTALMLVGFALRTHHLDAVSLRGDETLTILNWAQQPLRDTLTNIATADPHPPLAYALFRGWGQIFGTSAFMMRLLPALLNLLAIPALYAIGHRIGGRRMGLLAALLWTINPFQIWHAQDARNYAIWASFSAIGIWLALRALDFQRPVDWALYALAAIPAAYVYYLELFTIVTLNIYVFSTHRHSPALLRRWIIVQVAIGLVITPWFLQERLLFNSGYGGTTGNVIPSKWLTWFLPTLTFGSTLSSRLNDIVWPLVFTAITVSFLVSWRTNRKHTLLLGLMGTLPLILLGLISSKLNVFTPRYVLAAAPAYTLLIAALILSIYQYVKPPRLQRFIPIALASGWLIVTLASLTNYYTNPLYAKAPGWQELVSYLDERVTPDDLVIQTAADESFTFYYDNRGVSADSLRLPASPQQLETEITTALAEGSANYRSVWIVAQTFPDWPNAGIVESWVEDNLQAVRRTVVSGLRAEQYMPWRVRESEIQMTPIATFTDVAEVTGIRILPPSGPTEELIVLVYWQPLGPSSAPLKGFLHLIGNQNPDTGSPLWSQDDHFPQQGRANTTSWSQTTVYRDVYALPISGIPPGSYSLQLGLYDPETGQRQQLPDGTDSFLIEPITLP